jgi:hypothetical protein
MTDLLMNRKQFLAKTAWICAGSCACAMTGGVSILTADENTRPDPDKIEKPRSEVRIEFAEKWVTRFMDILDGNLDDATKKKIMEENGRRCFINWITETGSKVQQATLEQFAEWVKNEVTDDTFRVEGNVIYFQFTSAAETGEPSRAGQCLWTFVESKPQGLSPTYCHCSVGYVKEWFERKFGKPVEVELVDSVLMGGDWCKFKIIV